MAAVRAAPHAGVKSRPHAAGERELTPANASPRIEAMKGLPYALVAALLLAASPAADAAVYQWTDEDGVVRYTADPSRIPGPQRATMVRVEPGMAPATAPPTAPLPVVPGSGATQFEADPFNAPEQARTLEEVDVAAPGPRAQDVAVPPQSSARRAELVARIAKDEERLKALISSTSPDGSAPLVDSSELREIARRLPALQAELRALDERASP